jgi:hypothetical protein
LIYRKDDALYDLKLQRFGHSKLIKKQRMETTMGIIPHAIGFGIATVLVVWTVAPVGAAPVLSNTAVLKSVAESTVTEVRYGIRRGVARAAVATGVGLAVAGAARAYGYGYPYSYGYQSYSYGYPSYSYGYPSSYGYAPYSTGYAPYSYNYGYSGYSYNYGYAPGYYGYGVRRAARGVARRAYYRR